MASEVSIGCVFVRGGRAIARSRNHTNGFRNLFLYILSDSLSRRVLMQATRHDAELEAIDAILADPFSDTSQFASSKRGIPPHGPSWTQRFASPSNLVSCVPSHSVRWVSNACSTVARSNDSEGVGAFLVLTT